MPVLLAEEISMRGRSRSSKRQPPPPASPEEQALFRAAVTGVRPLEDNSLVFVQRTLLPPRWRKNPVASIPLQEPSEMELDERDHLEYRRSGIQLAVWRRLRRGEYPHEARLDLHGRTVEEARSLLTGFLARARQQGAKCVLVVHGKGFRSPGHAPVLKPRVAYWLAHAPEVTAYVSALPVDGGTGALYVLLKRCPSTDRDEVHR